MNRSILNETDRQRRKRVDDTLNTMRANDVGFSRDSYRIREGLYAQGRTPEQRQERMQNSELEARQKRIESETRGLTEQERIRQDGLENVARIESNATTQQERIRQEGLKDVEQARPRQFQILGQGSAAFHPETGQKVADNPMPPEPDYTEPYIGDIVPITDEMGDVIGHKVWDQAKRMYIRKLGKPSPF